MFPRKCVFACVLLVCFSGITYAQRESALRPGTARPTPKPSPTPTDADGNPVGGKGGGTHAVTGRDMVLAMATPTPTPKPTPSDPDATPVTGKPGGPHAKAQFDGAWTLDKTRSEGLSQRMQGADKVAWIITQDDKTISIDQKVEGGQPAGGGGGAGFGGGGRPPAGPPAYKLDGSESTMEVGQGKSTLKVTWAGNALELSRKSTFAGPNGEVTTSETRKLELSGDGKVLTAKVHSEGPRGAMDMTLVFKRE